jgi:hypothetical protein
MLSKKFIIEITHDYLYKCYFHHSRTLVILSEVYLHYWGLLATIKVIHAGGFVASLSTIAFARCRLVASAPLAAVSCLVAGLQ